MYIKESPDFTRYAEIVFGGIRDTRGTFSLQENGLFDGKNPIFAPGQSAVIRRKLSQKRRNQTDFVAFENDFFLHEYASKSNVVGIQKYLQDLS